MPETAHDRDLALDFAKGVLIILVIVGHLIQYILKGFGIRQVSNGSTCSTCLSLWR